MKPQKTKLFIIALISCLFCTCRETGYNKQLMDAAAAIAEQQPDSALILLQQVDTILVYDAFRVWPLPNE